MMAGRVVPSQVVSVIDRMFPKTATQVDAQESMWVVGSGASTMVTAVVEVVEHIPPELIVLDGPDFISYIGSIAALRNAIEEWRAKSGFSLVQIGGMGYLNPLTLLRRALEKCPDVYPAPATTALAFVSDPSLRENLQNDMSSATRGIAEGEWKATTVVGGSVVEALLLWALQQQTPASISAAVNSLVGAKVLGSLPPSDLEQWSLHEYVEAAAHLRLIREDTAAQIRIARNFRNLIHPGRAARLGQACDRGTALSTLAAIEHTVRDLTP